MLGCAAGVERSSRVTGPAGSSVEARWTLLDDGVTAVIESRRGGRPRVFARTAQRTVTTTQESASSSVRLSTVVQRASWSGSAVPRRPTAELAWRRRSASSSTALRCHSPARISRASAPWTFHGGIPALLPGDRRCHGRRQSAERAAGRCSRVRAAEGRERRRSRGARHGARAPRAIVGDPGDAPGDGAAGGLGYGLRVFLGAATVSGVGFVLEHTRLRCSARARDLVLTGEGRARRPDPRAARSSRASPRAVRRTASLSWRSSAPSPAAPRRCESTGSTRSSRSATARSESASPGLAQPVSSRPPPRTWCASRARPSGSPGRARAAPQRPGEGPNVTVALTA